MARMTHLGFRRVPLRQRFSFGLADVSLVAAAIFCSFYLVLVAIVSILHAAHVL